MSMGFLGKCSINDTVIPFMDESMGATDTNDDDVGCSGSFDTRQERVVKVQQDVRGSIRLRPTPLELEKLLNAFTGDTKGVDNLIEFQAAGPTAGSVIVDKVQSVCTYAACKMNGLTLTAAAGGVLYASADFLGTTESVAGSVGSPTHGAPYVMTEAVFTWGQAYPIRNITLAMSRNCPEDAFNNSPTRSYIPAGRLSATLAIDTPFNSAAAATLRTTGIAGAAATLVFTKGTNVLTITLANVKFPQQTPPVSGRDAEIMMSVTGGIYATAAAVSIVFSSVLA